MKKQCVPVAQHCVIEPCHTSQGWGLFTTCNLVSDTFLIRSGFINENGVKKLWVYIHSPVTNDNNNNSDRRYPMARRGITSHADGYRLCSVYSTVLLPEKQATWNELIKTVVKRNLNLDQKSTCVLRSSCSLADIFIISYHIIEIWNCSF